MKKRLHQLLSFLCVLVLLAACVPYSFSPPTQIHINPGDHVTEPVIAVDAAGRSHIAGVVNDRIVYTRTTFGDPKVGLTMTMMGSGINWRQSSPDIAATAVGTTWLVWVEQRGGPEKFACYQSFPLFPPLGGYETGCHPLDGTNQTTGNVMVVSRGTRAFVLYDRANGAGLIDSLWYKELTHPSSAGKIYQYADSESIFLQSWDAGIDTYGYLHVALLENISPSVNRLKYHSNRTVDADGTMTQIWVAGSSEDYETEAPVSMSFFQGSTTEIMAIASVFESGGADMIVINLCPANGCVGHSVFFVTLPTAWSTQSVITDVELVGIETSLHLGFIGDNSPTMAAQVYYMPDVFSDDPPLMPSDSHASFKFDLEAVKVDPRPESPSPVGFAAFSWGEMDSDSIEYYSYDGLVLTPVYKTDCLSSLVTGETASNGVYHVGVFKVCGETWFTTQANTIYLPVISK